MEKGKMEEGKLYFGNWGDGVSKEIELNIYAVRILIDGKGALLTGEHIESIGIDYVRDDVGVLEIKLRGLRETITTKAKQ